MGDYYNATRGPLSASLTDGSALSIGPKKWIFISPENENSASIVKLLDKGFLVRAKAARSAPASAALVPAPAPERARAPVRPSAPTPAKEASLSFTSSSTSSMKEEFSRKKK
jgi:hypothetical protein